MKTTFLTQLSFVILAFVAAAILSFTAVAQDSVPPGRYETYLARAEQAVAAQLPDFELIREVRSFPDRINATLAVRYDTVPTGAVVTLHDYATGRPLESCVSPCELHGDPNTIYHVYAFRLGHRPAHRWLEAGMSDGEKTIFLGPNHLAIERAKYRCYLEWMESEKADSEAAICFRHPPQMPPDAVRSGHCEMVFDVTVHGQPTNIQARSCSDPVFRNASGAAIASWHYYPRTERGQALVSEGVETVMTFKLADENGNLIPEE